MYHSVDRIAGKPQDYKLCKKCMKINWYENDECIECGNPALKINYDNLSDSRIADLLEDFEGTEERMIEV